MTFEDARELFCARVGDEILINDSVKCKFIEAVEVHDFGFDIDKEDGFVFTQLQKDKNCPMHFCEAIIQTHGSYGKIVLMRHDDMNTYSATLSIYGDDMKATSSMQIIDFELIPDLSS